MKAKTFIEYWKAPVSEAWSIHKVYDLLSSEFKHTDIIRLFSNTEKEDNRDAFTEFRYSFNSKRGYEGDIQWLKGNKRDFRIYIDNYPGQKKYFAFNAPIYTINDFLTICSTTGVELIWKQEVIDKYFSK
jgi:hypothetical protein